MSREFIYRKRAWSEEELRARSSFTGTAQCSHKGADHSTFLLQLADHFPQVGLVDIPLLLKRNRIFATSNVERRAVFRKFAKSIFETLPEPSAMLFVMLRVAPRSCSAKRKRRRLSNRSANRNSFGLNTAARFQISSS